MPLSGSSYMPLPKSLAKNKESILNIENVDKCALWCILASMHPASKSEASVEHYKPFVHDVDMKDIETPLT